MNRLQSCLPVILFIICTCSCKKDPDNKNEETSGSILSKVMIWDAIDPKKGIQIIDFTYDNANRVTEINYSGGDSVNGAINASVVRTSKCFYNGNEKNPYKTTGLKLPLGYPSADVYHYYNNAGVLTNDSIGDTRISTGYYKRAFAWSSDKIITTNATTYSGSLRQTKDTMIIDGNNIKEFYNNTTSTATIDVVKYKHDGKVNPLTKLNIAACTVVDGTDGIEGFVAPGYCKNNITEIEKTSITNSGGVVTTKKATTAYTYMYNEKGLPMQRWVSTPGGSTITRYYYKD